MLQIECTRCARNLFWRKYLHLADLVPDIDVLVALEPDELGLHILQVTNGGHCGGDGSVLRFRALVAMTNWRGLRRCRSGSGWKLKAA
jgi:hypothetical protein